MKSGVLPVSVGETLTRTRRDHKVQRKDYLPEGQLPVIDQGAQFVGGWTDDLNLAYEGELPVVVFGDHTCSFKYVDRPFAVGADGTQILRPSDDWDIRYFYYCLLTTSVEQFGYQRHFKYLKEAVIPWRQLDEQRQIASVLSTYDDLIENNARRIQILEEIAQAIYRDWFVEFRYPGHENEALVESEVGQVPSGWATPLLSDLVTTQYGYTESTSAEPIGPRFLRGMDMNKTSYIDWSQVPYCPISAEDLEKYRLRVGDILIIRMADPGKVGIVEVDAQAVFASYLVRIRPRDNAAVRPYFLFHYLLSDRYQAYVTGASTGTTRKSVSAKVMTEVRAAIPPATLQTKFEAHVAPIRGLLCSLLQANANLRTTRDLLLPRLMSGEVDVSNLEIATSGLSA